MKKEEKQKLINIKAKMLVERNATVERLAQIDSWIRKVDRIIAEELARRAK